MKQPLWVLLAAFLATIPSTAQTSPSTSQSRAETPPLADHTRTTPRKLRSIRQRLCTTIDSVNLDNTPARKALDWWSRNIDTCLVVNWRIMDDAGINPQTPVTLRLRRVPAEQVLALILRQLQGDQKLIFQTTAWYIQVLTMEEANRQTEVRIYDVGDLLHVAPFYANAPRLDLQIAFSNTNRSGGGSWGSGSAGAINIFALDQKDNTQQKTRGDRVDDLLQLIRNTTEPYLWVTNGGPYASISFFKGKFIVNAPPMSTTRSVYRLPVW